MKSSDFRQATAEHFERAGLEMAVSNDMAAWAELMRDVNPWHVSPTHDPAFSHFTPENAFWLRVSRRSEVVACIAHRTFRNAQLTELIRSNHLWYARPEPVRHFEIIDRETVESIFGDIGFVGGLWVAETERENGIATCLSRNCRLIGVEEFGTDWHIAIIKSDNVKRGRGRGYLGHQRLVRLMNGYYPPTKQVMELYLAHMSREDVEIFNAPSAWPHQLLP